MRVELPAVLSLGSNLGDRQATILAAVADIAAIPGVTMTGVSSIVESAAMKSDGMDATAPRYLNAVVAIRTVLSPERLLEATGEIERAHGRVRTETWGDRTLDIDIVSVGSLRMKTDTVTIPHPRAADRAFVLVPWLELEPGARLPGFGRVADLPAASDDGVFPYSAESP